MFASERPASLIELPRRKLPREGLTVAALDMGSAKTACFLANIHHTADGHIDCDVVGAGHCGAGDRSGSDGVNDAGSTGLARKEGAIRRAVDAAETMAGDPVHGVSFLVPGTALRTIRLVVDLDLASGFVTREDLAESLAEGQRLITPEGHRAIHTLATRYQLDGVDTGPDPKGQCGHVLTTHILGICVPETRLVTWCRAVESAGLSVAGWCAAPFAAGEAVITDDEKQFGTLVLDLGADETGYALFRDGQIYGCGGVGFGGARLAREVAQNVSTSIREAARQIILNGTLLASTSDAHRIVEMTPLAPDEPMVRISRAELSAVLTGLVETLYEKVVEQIRADGCDMSFLRRLILTGGTSQLHGAREHAEGVFGLKTRLGRPADLHGTPEALTGPAFAAGLGALSMLTQAYRASAGRGESVEFRPTPRTRSVLGWLKANF